MSLRFFLLLVLTGTTAFARWQRHVAGTTGFFTDSPPPHPLAYFQVDPCLRPETDYLVRAIDCISGTPSDLERRRKTQVDLH